MTDAYMHTYMHTYIRVIGKHRADGSIIPTHIDHIITVSNMKIKLRTWRNVR
jgi:hypothetical protein